MLYVLTRQAGNCQPLTEAASQEKLFIINIFNVQCLIILELQQKKCSLQCLKEV
jgi:hypothetical protein